MYDDDTSLIIDREGLANIASTATDELMRVEQWFSDNGLVLNHSKTTFFNFECRQNASNYSLLVGSLNGLISQVDTAKFPGRM
nr:unnamed protein product [Callosobruchus analis]